jgi:hypothetical protein
VYEYIADLTNKLELAYLEWRGGGGRGSVVIKALCYDRNIAGSRPGEVKEFSLIYVILPAALGPGVHSTCNRAPGAEK